MNQRFLAAGGDRPSLSGGLGMVAARRAPAFKGLPDHIRSQRRLPSLLRAKVRRVAPDG